ncbi:hypothetical protein SBRCBS47491_001897 [Sporothrix bragantina]|uniref:DUF7924 domain-containing protein n=1 Tax=Sporothrix bragantina TaxID=671064 RepID=A0ABP0B269_9PEZI
MDKGRKDAKGFATPSTPSLVSGCTNQSGATAGSQKYGADDPIYRSDILRDNNIILRPQWEPRPDNVRALVAKMNQARSSPEPPAEQIRREALFEKVYQGGSKTQVEDYFKDKVFALTAPTSTEKGDAPLQASTRALMNRQGVPFLQPRRGFFGPAANQCMGGSASCVNIAEKLNRQLREYRYKNQNGNGEVVNANVDSTAFSIAMNGNEARLYVSWKHDELSYYVSDVQCYLLSRPDHYIDFRKVVRNILDWGKNERLEAIRKSLDILIEEDRKRSMEEARAWRDTSPGTSSSSSSRGKKPRRS